jgi:hypothetical protein
VAGGRLIDAYLSELRYSAAKLRDIDDVLVEIEDHLVSSVDAAVARGVPREEAESHALARFGSPQLVARVFVEEANRGGAVSTTVTRRAGVAAMLAPVLVLVGEVGNETIDRGPLHGVAVALILAGFATFVVALWGLRQRHGGLGAWGRTGLWLFVASPVISIPFMWAAGVVFAFVMTIVVFLLGVGMMRARVLPQLPVALFTLVPLPLGLLVGMATASFMNSLLGVLAGAASCAIGLLWIGWIMSHEPALDVPAHMQPPGSAALPVT